MEATRSGPGASAVAEATVGLTFLMTDIEGSTPLWEQHEATMRPVLARHDRLLDAVIAAHGGHRVRERGEGDSVFAVFAQPAAAVAAAVAIQQALLAEPWPAETPIRVRMGLHTGTAEVREGDYYGTAVNRCARIRGLGHGGQVLLSAATAALAREALPRDAGLRSLGAHSLKGLAQAEEVYQVLHPTLVAEFPPLLSPQAPKHNLPAALPSFIGREREQGAVLALLDRAPLVTLTGSGGVGKTRLALAVAGELVDQYLDGAWLAELAALADPALAPHAVAAALGLREEAGRPLLATLADHLAAKQLLLVLDNCEHLAAACAALAAVLLRACPGLRILATSREALEVAGETTYRVPSLAVPAREQPARPELLAECEAVQLFVERAQARRPDFALTAQNARAVAAICAQLDGIPLAIELAAARVGTLPVEEIASRLNDCFRLLTGGPRNAPPRQRTLHATLDWSYNLLAEPERALLRRLSVFAGGWTLEAAEVVCTWEGIAGWEVLDLLAGLVHKSLVLLEEQEGAGRYRLLETVRQYALERLAEAGEPAAARERHLAWCVMLAEEAEPKLKGPEQATWLTRLDTEHDNLRAALAWARESGAFEGGLRLAGALWPFWDRRGYLGEGRVWMEGALVGGQGTSGARAKALNGAGVLAWMQGEYEPAAALHEEALALRRALGGQRDIAIVLNNLGNVAHWRGDDSAAEAYQEEALALFRALGDRDGIAYALDSLGNLADRRGEHGRAKALHEEALALRRALGDRRGIAIALSNLALVAERQGEYDRATALHQEALAIHRALGDRAGIAYALNSLGNVAYWQGEHRRAQALHEEALALCRELGEMDGSAVALHGLGDVACARGEHDRAGALLEDALALRRGLGDTHGITIVLQSLGIAAYARGEYGRSAALHKESLQIGRDIGAQDVQAEALEGLAWSTATLGQPWRAARLGGAAAVLRETLGVPLAPVALAAHDRAVQAMRAALGEETFATAWAEGRALPLEQAITLALA